MSTYLNDEIRKMTAKKWLNFVDGIGEIPIGINVRMGNDFVIPMEGKYIENTEAIRTSIAWFVDSLNLIRKILNKPVRAVVVSDGTEESLSELLCLENVYFLRPGCAISDLLALSKSKILIRSGGSSFSAWASFLGQMPTISPKGQSLSKFNLINDYGYHIGEFDPLEPDVEFIAQIKEVFKKI